MHTSAVIAFGLVVTFVFDLVTLKTFSALYTSTLNICAKFRYNLSTKYGDIASREIHVNGRTDGRHT